MSRSNDSFADFSEAFFEESAEHVATVEDGLLRLDAGTLGAEGMHGVFRAVHSIKGLAATLGFGEVASFTHDFESVLDRLRSGSMAPSPEFVQLLLRANDALRTLLDASRAGTASSVATAGETAALRAVLDGPEVPAAIPPTAAVLAPAGPDVRQYSIRFLPRPQLFATGQDPMLVVWELA
jgi:two-component system, chemotaxis family, sensor kinase CheA